MIDTSPPPLAGIRVLDLSRVLAGPSCTQILGDLGAEVIKIEQQQTGDDTRHWGPPWLEKQGQQNDQPDAVLSPDQSRGQSAYYLSANRNKKSLTVNLKDPRGQDIIRKLAVQSDIVVENFKTGTLKRYGLDYETLAADNKGLIYASITGFGQNGPLARQPGYDFIIQALSGLMSISGEVNGHPMKTGVAIADILTGLYTAIGILSALHHRNQTGQGQSVDMALFDCQLAALTNVAQYYLTSGTLQPRQGNAHATIVPYQLFETADQPIVVAIGNDRQFAQFCHHAGAGNLANDPRFSTNESRVVNRGVLIPQLAEIFLTKNAQDWIAFLQEHNIPCGVIQTLDQVFSHPQTQARDMLVTASHPYAEEGVKLVGSPLKFSHTPVAPAKAPPLLGADTSEVLRNWLGLDDQTIEDLVHNKVI